MMDNIWNAEMKILLDPPSFFTDQGRPPPITAVCHEYCEIHWWNIFLLWM